MLFSENLKVSQTVLLFLENNRFFSESSKKTIYTGGEFCLMGKNGTPFEIKRLSNFLSFLKIEEKTKKYLINSCLELDNYSPFSTYLRKMKKKLLIDSKKQLKEEEFEKEKTEIENKLKIFKREQKNEEERFQKERKKVQWIYIRHSTFFLLLTLIASKTFFDIYGNRNSKFML